MINSVPLCPYQHCFRKVWNDEFRRLGSRYARLGGVWIEVDFRNGDDITLSVLFAVFEWGVTRDIEVVLDHHSLVIAAEEAEGAGGCKTESQGNDSGKPHRWG